MKSTSEDQYPADLAEILAVLKPAPVRDPQTAARRRSEFLVQAQTFAVEAPRPEPEENRSTRGVKAGPIQILFSRLAGSARLPRLFPILLVLALILAGGGATVYAAQKTLPGRPLYPLKTWSEALRLALTEEPEAQIRLHLDFAGRRAGELVARDSNPEELTEAHLARYQAQVELALELAAGLDDPRMARVLAQIRERLQSQSGLIQQAQSQFGLPAAAYLAAARAMLRGNLEWVEVGLADPQAFREHMRWKGRNGPAGAPAEPQGTPNPASTPGSSPGGDPISGQGAGPGSGPFSTGTPASGGEYGQGPNRDSGGGFSPGAGNPPEPGRGPGPGPGDSSGDMQQYGPGAGPTPESGADPAAPESGETGSQIGSDTGTGPKPDDRDRGSGSGGGQAEDGDRSGSGSDPTGGDGSGGGGAGGGGRGGR